MDLLSCRRILYTIFIILVINGLSTVFAGEYCYMYSYGYYNLYLGYCSNDCCGYSAYYRYCCYDYSYAYAYWSIGSIVGAAIGGLIGLVVAIVVIIIICQQCNKRTTRGAVISPQTQTTTSHQVVYSTTQNYVPPPQQPPYQPPQQPAPSNIYGTDPAYPPSTAMYPPGPPEYTPTTKPPAYST